MKYDYLTFVFCWELADWAGNDLDAAVPHLGLAAQVSANAKPNTLGHNVTQSLVAKHLSTSCIQTYSLVPKRGTHIRLLCLEIPYSNSCQLVTTAKGLYKTLKVIVKIMCTVCCSVCICKKHWVHE